MTTCTSDVYVIEFSWSQVDPSCIAPPSDHNLLGSVLTTPCPVSFTGRVRNETIRHFCRTEIADRGAIAFVELYPDTVPAACDLLSHLLVFDPVQSCSYPCMTNQPDKH